MGCKPSKHSTDQIATANTTSSSKVQKKELNQCVPNKETNIETEAYMDVPMLDNAVAGENHESSLVPDKAADESDEEEVTGEEEQEETVVEEERQEVVEEQEVVAVEDERQEEVIVEKEEQEEGAVVEEERQEIVEEEEGSIVEEEMEEKNILEVGNVNNGEDKENIAGVCENIEQVEDSSKKIGQAEDVHLANIVEEEGKFHDADSPNRFFSSTSNAEHEEVAEDKVVALVEPLSESKGSKYKSMETFPEMVVEEDEVAVEEVTVLLNQDEEEKTEADVKEENLMEKKETETAVKMEEKDFREADDE